MKSIKTSEMEHFVKFISIFSLELSKPHVLGVPRHLKKKKIGEHQSLNERSFLIIASAQQFPLRKTFQMMPAGD